jgi:hypothetical protein
MNFDALEESIPYLVGEELYTDIITYDDVRIKQPGKYQKHNNGGDFVVDTLIGGNWVPLRHADYFDIVSDMIDKDAEWVRNKLGPALVMLSKGTLGLEDIDKIPGGPFVRGVSPRTFLRTMLLILVAEHRRGAAHEPLGGRNLVLRFLLGIIYGNWTVDEAKLNIKAGKPGLKKLRWRTSQEPSFVSVLEGIS